MFLPYYPAMKLQFDQIQGTKEKKKKPNPKPNQIQEEIITCVYKLHIHNYLSREFYPVSE